MRTPTLRLSLALCVGAAAAPASLAQTRPDSQLLELASGNPVLEGAVHKMFPGGGGGGGADHACDVIVGRMSDIMGAFNCGGGGCYATTNGIAAYALGTVGCNMGAIPLAWEGSTSNHPIIAQNLYRYKVVEGAGHFEQIGMSWMKHSFLALQQTECGPCPNPYPNGTALAPQCSDPYNASLNGGQSRLGPRDQVNGYTGNFPYPFSAPATDPNIGRRLQVRIVDLDPAQNAGARYFGEGQYISAFEAEDPEHSVNNASYRQLFVSGASPSYALTYNAGVLTSQMQSALWGWRGADASVQIASVDIPGEGRFELAWRVTDLGNGTWHYEYALRNMNSDRAAGSVSVPVFPGDTVSKLGFTHPFYHSSAPADDATRNAEWTVTQTPDGVTWAAPVPYNPANPTLGNALRFSTMYTFRFDANAAPTTGRLTIGLYTPGTPSTLAIDAQVPGRWCYADCDPTPTPGLNVADFTCFLQSYAAGDPYANCDGSLTQPVLNVADFTCFLQRFASGCP